MLSRLSQKFYVQLILLFAGFAVCRFLCSAVFFEGFLTTFKNINAYWSLDKTALFAHDPFHSSSIILSALIQPFFLLLLLLLYVPLLLKRKELKQKFAAIPLWERLIPFVSALLLAWELTTYDYNYYLDHAFYFDRILLIALAILILRRPVFIPLFIAASFVYRVQFNYPVEGFPLFDKRLLFDLLEMFLVYSYLKLFVRDFRIPFLFATLCIVGSNYFMSFMGKIFISPLGYQWLTEDHLTDLFANVHQRGWIMNANTYLAMYGFLQKLDGIFRALILLVEFAGILLFWRRKWSVVFMIFFFLMHIGIFVFGSMLFWKWMVIDALVAFILIRYKTELELLFTREFRRASVFFIFTSFLWLQPYNIAWCDTSCTQLFRYVAIDDNGKKLNVDKNMFNPYHQWIEYDHLLFLVNKDLPPLTGFGYVGNWGIRNVINEYWRDSVPSLGRYSRNTFSPEKKKLFDGFVAAYFHNRNLRPGSTSFFAAPDHLHTSVVQPAYDGTQHIKTIQVYFDQIRHEGTKYFVLSSSLIDEIEIPE